MPDAVADTPLARRLSAVLSAAMLAVFFWGLYHYTAGFEVWTFEGQRQRQLQAGALRAAPVPLVGTDGAPVALWQTAGAPPAAYLVDFIYTRCPSVCSALGNEYQQMQAQLAQLPASPARNAVHLVSISFDVEHDNPASLRAYARVHQADAAWWTLAMPASASDTRALLNTLGVIAVPDGLGGYVHNGAIHLLDESGRLRGLFAWDAWPQALSAAQQLASAPREVPR